MSRILDEAHEVVAQSSIRESARRDEALASRGSRAEEAAGSHTVGRVTTKQTQEDRDAASALYLPHLLYEIQQMGDSAGLAKKATAAYAAAVESSLIHARLLIEFLMGRPKKNSAARSRKPGDIKPSMFVTSWNPTDRDRFDIFLGRLDRHLVHLTKERGTIALDDGSWARVEIPGILGVMTEFAVELEKAKSQHAYAVMSACKVASSRI